MSTTKDVIQGDPVLAIHFMVDFAGITGYFMSIDGLGSESEVVEQKVMADGKDSVVRKQPGRLTWGDITLKRGLTTNMDFYDWIDGMINNDPTASRKDGSIIMMDAMGAPVAQWDILQAWPSKVTGPSISADSSEAAMEEITLVHEGITRSV